ncbi:MAG: bifunctional DNA primase/polymerase [Pirellulales bacterium]
MGYKDFNLPFGKSPPPKGWQALAGSVQLSEDGWRGRSTENFFVLDIDSHELIERAMQKFKERITTVVVTPSGGKHLYFSGVARNQQRNGYDVRSEGGYVCIPPSPGYRYETPLVPLEYLRPFPPELLKEPNASRETTTIVREARCYILGIFAVAGQRGHSATFKAACKLRDEGLSEAEALAEMVEWNRTNANPPWSTKELLHKVSSAYAKVKK